jgi:hypothetical protein
MKTVAIHAGMRANLAVTWFAFLEKWDGCRHGPSLENDGTKMIGEFRNKRFEGKSESKAKYGILQELLGNEK